MASFEIPILCMACDRVFEGVGRIDCPYCEFERTREPPVIYLWDGKPLTELSRDELIAALIDTGDAYLSMLKNLGKALTPRFGCHRQ